MNDQAIVATFFLTPLLLGGIFMLWQGQRYSKNTDWSQRQFLKRHDKNASPKYAEEWRQSMIAIYRWLGGIFLFVSLAGFILVGRSLI